MNGFLKQAYTRARHMSHSNPIRLLQRCIERRCGSAARAPNHSRCGVSAGAQGHTKAAPAGCVNIVHAGEVGASEGNGVVSAQLGDSTRGHLQRKLGVVLEAS
jgi:hypothetical protein